jgi:uncharacterized membrane protein YfcA
LLDERLLAILFAALLGYVAFTMARGARTAASASREPAATDDETAAEASGHAAIDGEAPSDVPGLPPYEVRNLRLGQVGATGAGIASALLGVGGGIIMVPLMHLAMGVPLRVATATSNLMVGITAAASSVIYLLRGEIDPYVAGPTAIGVFLGASLGSRLAHRVDLRVLRWLFVIVLLYTAIQMLLKAIA